jgi:hypothetical protein
MERGVEMERDKVEEITMCLGPHLLVIESQNGSDSLQ